MKKRVCLLAGLLCLSIAVSVPVSAQETGALFSTATVSGTSEVSMASEIPTERQLPRLVDRADLLTDGEEEKLLAQLESISERQRFDVVVVTVDSLDGKTPQEYADDFFDYNGYGYGENYDGALLLVSIADRDWYISTSGYGITAITDAGREMMSERFLPSLSAGEYADAFRIYADICDDFVTRARDGSPYDVDDSGQTAQETKAFPWFAILLGSLVLGFIIALCVTGSMRRKLKSVRMQLSANTYVRPGGLDLLDRRDQFLYSHVSRTAKPKNDSGSSSGGSSGGSSTHTSSSGRTHGGGGGKF